MARPLDCRAADTWCQIALAVSTFAIGNSLLRRYPVPSVPRFPRETLRRPDIEERAIPPQKNEGQLLPLLEPKQTSRFRPNLAVPAVRPRNGSATSQRNKDDCNCHDGVQVDPVPDRVGLGSVKHPFDHCETVLFGALL